MWVVRTNSYFAAQDLLRQLHADPVGFLRRDLPRLKRLDEVPAQVRAPCPMAWRRVQANSMSAVSAEQPKEDTSSFPSVLSDCRYSQWPLSALT